MMVQIKKNDARVAILNAANRLFAEKGYQAATLREIAQDAGMSLSNLYVYFPSKYRILFEIYDPWMTERLERLEDEATAIADRRQRLRHIIETLWREIPAENNGFARNIMQALSTAVASTDYDPTMIRWAEAKISRLLASCLPPRRRSKATSDALAHILMMAFDGFAINQNLNPDAACIDVVVDAMCGSLVPR